MTDNTQPEALRDARWYMVNRDGMATLCTDREDAEQEAKDANLAWTHTAPHRAVQLVEVGTAAAELHRQHARITELESRVQELGAMARENRSRRIVELEAQLEAVGAGGVQALSAAPEAIAKLRHLYKNLMCNGVRGTEDAKRIAQGLLAPAIEALERATPPAEQQAEESSVKLLAECRDAFPVPEHGSPIENEWIAAVGSHEAVPAYLQAVAKQQAITPETGNSVSAQGAAITSESGAVYAELPELTSAEINDACWAFVEAMPHNLPGPIWNDLKPAVYAAICKFLQAAPKAAAVKACVCGEPQAPGTVHRVDGPCYVAAPQQDAQEPCQTCAALARTVMCDQVSFDRKPDCYGIRQITDDEGVEEWEDIRTSPDVAREEANDMMATGRGEIYEVVPLWTTPQPAPAPLSDDAKDAARLAKITQAIRDYHFALDCREHGGVAMARAWNAICDVLNMDWVQGAERAARKQGGKP